MLNWDRVGLIVFFFIPALWQGRSANPTLFSQKPWDACVSKYELMFCNPVDNQGNLSPKQAFRLEILDSFKVGEKAHRYHEGLIRYHIFLQDMRGKSQRGMLTPRLYLNRIVLPYVNLTFSSHDHIRLTNAEFNFLLERPNEFLAYWKKKARKPDKEKSGTTPDLPMR